MEMETIIKELTETTARSKSNTKRLDEVEKRQGDLEQLTISMAEVRKDLDHQGETVAEIRDDVKEMKAKPAKRWESLIEKALTVLVGALIGFLLTKLGLG